MPEIDITIARGKTFEFAYLYADDELVYLPITAMPSTAPARLTVPRHNIPDGWPVQITCVKSPAQLNSDPQGENPYYFVKVVDADTLELNEVNAHCWKAFSGSGLVVFNKPLDLTGWQCRAQVRTRIGGDVLLSWVSDQPGEGSEALVDVAASAFVLRIDPATTEAIAWKSGVYDLEAVSPDGNVHAVVGVSRVFVSDEVTA